MNEKSGCTLIGVFAAFALVGGIVRAINPAPPDPLPPEAQPKPEVQRTWNTTFDGLTVSCGIVGTDRWQIMFPSLDEREQGAQPVVDRSPPDYVWAKACGPSDPGPSSD